MESHHIAVVGAGTAGAAAALLLARAGHRVALFEALLAAARAEPRIALRCGIAIASTALADGARWLIGWLRDLVFPTSRWLPPLRRRMVRTIPLPELRRLALPPGAPS